MPGGSTALAASQQSPATSRKARILTTGNVNTVTEALPSQEKTG
jgi:hypothetical protein